MPRFLDLVTEPAPPISEAMRGLLERIGVNRTPIRHVAAVDQAASDLIDQKLLKRRFSGVLTDGLAVLWYSKMGKAPNVSPPAMGNPPPAG